MARVEEDMICPVHGVETEPADVDQALAHALTEGLE
jgi:hypothetical protein